MTESTTKSEVKLGTSGSLDHDRIISLLVTEGEALGDKDTGVNEEDLKHVKADGNEGIVEAVDIGEANPQCAGQTLKGRGVAIVDILSEMALY